MSEYQYYEWQTIDRLLTEDEQKTVNGFDILDMKQPKHYDAAVKVLAKLKELAEFRDSQADFREVRRFLASGEY